MDSTGRKAVRNVPTAEARPPVVRAHVRKQRRLLGWTASILLALAAGGWVYNYMAGTQARARLEMEAGLRKMSPGSYDQAIRSFDRAIDMWPEFAEAYLYRAIAKHDSSQRLPALADLDKALDLDPNLIRAYNERGQIYLEGADPKKAIQDFDSSIQVKPNLEGYYQRGEAYESLGEHQKAVADFDAAINEFPEAPYAYRARATAKRNMGDRDAAEADEQAAERLEVAGPR